MREKAAVFWEKDLAEVQGKETAFLIVGGGAAGLMAAAVCRERGISPVLLEKNRSLGRKLGITGKGRCNLTNRTDPQGVLEAVRSNPRFLYTAVHRFPPEDVMAFFEDRGVPLKTERGNRVFPRSDQAADIVSALSRSAGGTRLSLNTHVLAVQGRPRGGFLVETTKGRYRCQRLLLACGGSSYPGTGSNGDGIRLAKALGHEIVSPAPSLVPLVEDGNWCGQMQGLSLKNCGIQLFSCAEGDGTGKAGSVADGTGGSGTKSAEGGGKKIYSDFGELLFTHFGLSGPVILSASAHMRDPAGSYRIIIDLKPALDERVLDLRLQRELKENQNRYVVRMLEKILPQKMIPVMTARWRISPETRCHQVTKVQRRALGKLLKRFDLKLKGLRPLSEAIVTAGGVSVKEVNPKTMESKLVPGLYFAGELLDLDAYTGGYNLQIAFSTGHLAGAAVCDALGCV